MERWYENEAVTKYWLENYTANTTLCTLCGNTGIIDTCATAISPAGSNSGRLNYCICPNGQCERAVALKEGNTLPAKPYTPKRIVGRKQVETAPRRSVKKLWCVAWIPRDKDGKTKDSVEWCACLRQPKGVKRYQDTIATRCGMKAILPVGIEFRVPTCKDCNDRLK